MRFTTVTSQSATAELRRLGRRPPTASSLLEAAIDARRSTGCSSSTPTSASTPTTAPALRVVRWSAMPVPGDAYGFRVHRMIGDRGALRPRRALGLPAVRRRAGPAAARGDALHLVPVSRPRSRAARWRKTTDPDPAPRRPRRGAPPRAAARSTGRPIPSCAGSASTQRSILDAGRRALEWQPRPAATARTRRPGAVPAVDARPRGARPRRARCSRRS